MRYTEETRKLHLSRTEEVDQCEKQLKENARKVVEHVDRTSKSIIAVLTGSGDRSVNEDNFLPSRSWLAKEMHKLRTCTKR